MLKLRIAGANLDADVGAAARAALEAAAARLAAQVRQDLATPPGGPHDKPWRQTGALQASIGHVVEGDVATVGSISPYAAAQEHGTRLVPPRPFLLPAAKRLAPELARDIGRAVQAALAGEGASAPLGDPDSIVPSANQDDLLHNAGWPTELAKRLLGFVRRAPRPRATPESLAAESIPGRATRGRSTVYTRPGGGGYEAARREFDALAPTNVRPNAQKPGLVVGTLSDGRTVTVRPFSKDGRATLEIYDPTTGHFVKLRYN